MEPISVDKLKRHVEMQLDHFGDDRLASKLLSLGWYPGSILEVLHIAPLGGGYYVCVDGQNFALRKEEAAGIFVIPIEETAE